MPDVDFAQCAAIAALNAAAALLVGVQLALAGLLPRATPWSLARFGKLRRAAQIGVGVALLAGVVALWLEAASMAEVTPLRAWPAVFAMLIQTHYGHAWIAGTAALLVLAVANWRGRAPQSRGLAGLGLLALMAFFAARSAVSHAASDGGLSLAFAADWAHLVLIGVWAGTVLMAATLVLNRPAALAEQDGRHCADYLAALSRSATWALAGVGVTGLLGARHNLLGVGDLLGTAYGVTLLAKLALVALAVLLGGANRLLVMPALLSRLRSGAGGGPELRRFVLILRIEALVLCCVLVAAALLSATAPPTAG